MILEVCIDSPEGVLLAKKYGAKRVELCSALSVGGLTPSIGLVRQCLDSADDEVEIHAMIRHREGGFVYSTSEVEIMKEDIIQLAKIGVYGVVFGCLDSDFNIDIKSCELLQETAKQHGLETTFHRAFDFAENSIESLTRIIHLGFNRILTSGQQSKAIEGITMIRELVNLSGGRIEIMAGSGVNSTNAKTLAEAGVDALHFTSHNSISHELGMGMETIPDEEKIRLISNLFQ